jgi:hypothetical protein
MRIRCPHPFRRRLLQLQKPRRLKPNRSLRLSAGVYRSQLTVAGLAKLGLDDPSTAGIWTFTVHPGGAFEVQ